MPQIAGKKITLSFSPATANDEAVIESFLPQPHADGTPIKPNELPTSFPAYLINLKPELRIDGQVMASGAPAMMGSAHSFTLSLNEPGIGMSNIDNIIQAGEYFGIGLDTGRIGTNTFIDIGNKITATRNKLDSNKIAGLSKDDLIGDLLYMTIINYFAQHDIYDEFEAISGSLIRHRTPSIGMSSLVVSVKEIFGVPMNISSRGLMMDVDRVSQAVFSKDGNMSNVKQYMLSSGNRSSLMEHLVPEEIYSSPTNTVHAISAAKALQIANDSAIPVYSIDQSNIAQVLPQLEVSPNVKSDIVNAVNAGKIVTVSKSNIAFGNWNGCGYIIIDPITNAGAYMISSGTSGTFLEDAIQTGGLLIIATIGLILNSMATEAAAEELEPTYYNISSVPGCITPAYLHMNEYWDCVGTKFSEGLGQTANFLWLGLGTFALTYKKNPMIAFGMTVVTGIGIEAWAVRTAAKCRNDAIHCDKSKN